MVILANIIIIAIRELATLLEGAGYFFENTKFQNLLKSNMVIKRL